MKSVKRIKVYELFRGKQEKTKTMVSRTMF